MNRRHPLIRLILVLTWVVLAGAADGAALEELSLTRLPEPNRFSFSYTPDAAKPAVEGILAYPDGAGPFRAVVLNHGGGGYARTVIDHFAAIFLERKYVVAACDLAHAGKDSKAVEDPAESLRRLDALFRILENDDKVDARRVFVYGNSHGAFTTVAWCTHHSRIKAAAVTGGGLFGRTQVKMDFSKISAPILILHGAEDEIIPVSAAKRLKKALDRHGKVSQLEIVPHVGHDLPISRQKEVFAKILAFFDENAG